MARQRANPLQDPLHYASLQKKVGPPATKASAAREMPSYDYIIVGGGAAGCVLAGTLSEDQNVSVLLIEAGVDNNKLMETKAPLMYGKLFHGEHDWNYFTMEQSSLASRRLYWPRARVLGGCTSMNTMMYHHCSPSDYDEWVSKHGCDGWGYDDLAPSFREMEGYSWLTEIGEKGFLAACEESGIRYNSDVNTPAGSLGATRFQTSIDQKGQRSSPATAFLSPEARNRPNLFVACNARVLRVLFDRLSGEVPVAFGVELKTARDGPLFQAHARREVILSGGSVNTPQILMMSGIGAADELKKHGIALVKENQNVGKHLKDHLTSAGILCKARAGTTLDYLANDLKAVPALLRWLALGSGPLTSNVAEVAAFLRSVDCESSEPSTAKPADNSSGKEAPDLEIIGAPLAYIHHGEETAKNGDNIYSMVAVGLRPKSSGNITLRSSDPFDAPVIDPRYLSDEKDNDRKVLLVGMRMLLRIMRAPAFQKFFEAVPVDDDVTLYWWPYSSSDPDAITDEQLTRSMREKAFTLYHPVGTARMGPSASTSVVDLQCRVHGVEGLRVVDASIFPEQVSGHPAAPVAAIAYKASKIIRESYSN
ncbi:hypothetical protein QQS21_001573 [Conoideocrella luteorostrata]|uniref:Glucose-methanol-choline oxidoreductase N-terminal domain-containing protein n=1 Tax=Conoideocrella luteorostrata TaxID=1105319 RepID=A0AAJ0CZH8_9HYPO|nr:hypothetical protein QQS21_001573 [Conoideocrella luteorostrata]